MSTRLTQPPAPLINDDWYYNNVGFPTPAPLAKICPAHFGTLIIFRDGLGPNEQEQDPDQQQQAAARWD